MNYSLGDSFLAARLQFSKDGRTARYHRNSPVARRPMRSSVVRGSDCQVTPSSEPFTLLSSAQLIIR